MIVAWVIKDMLDISNSIGSRVIMYFVTQIKFKDRIAIIVLLSCASRLMWCNLYLEVLLPHNPKPLYV